MAVVTVRSGLVETLMSPYLVETMSPCLRLSVSSIETLLLWRPGACGVEVWRFSVVANLQTNSIIPIIS